MILRRFNKAELVLTQRLHLDKPMLLLVALAATGYLLSRGDFVFFLLVAVGLVLNAMALSLRSEIALPRPAITIAVLLATGFFVFDFLQRRDFFGSIGPYIALLLLCKLLERRRNRDYAEMIVLALMLMLGGALVSISLGYGLCLLLFVPICCYTSMVLTIKIALDRQAGLQLSVERTGPDPQTLAWNMSGRFPARTIARQAAQAMMQCVLAAAVVYLLMPRLAPGSLLSSFLGYKFPSGGVPSTGMPTRFRLTDLGRITPDPRVVMQVKIADADGHDLGRTGYAAYLRGAIYETYRNGEWFPVALPPSSVNTLHPIDRTYPNLLVQYVTMDPSLAAGLPTSEVFAIAPLAGVAADADELWADSGQQLLDTRSEDAPLQYVAYSWNRPFSWRQSRRLRTAEDSRPGPAEPDTISPRVAELARQWCGDLAEQRDRLVQSAAAAHEIDDLDQKIAVRLMDTLRDGYTYTLDLRDFQPDIDPVEDFLFNTRRGHCEFFASAMTLMARSLGLEARMCGGFLADQRSYSTSSGQYLVRASDAHAWVEIFLPSQDWVLYDPTPAGATNEPPGRLQSVRHFWGNVLFFWRTKVMGYGEKERNNILGKAFKDLLEKLRTHLMEAGQAAFEIFRNGLDRRLLLRLLPGLALLLSGAAIILLGIELIRRRLRKRRMLVRPQHVPAFYRRLHRLLEKRGLPHRVAQTPREYLAHAAQELHLSEPAMAELADCFYDGRWGDRPLSEERRQRAEKSVQELAQQLRRR